MLTVLLHSEVGDIAAVVSRYFGGIKLGKGGLVKAYSGGVQQALESLPRTEWVPKTQVRMVLEYGHLTPVQRIMPEFEVETLEQEYGAEVTFQLQLPAEHLALFLAAMRDLTNGRALVKISGEQPDG